jgi:hypothetical protein
MKLDREKYRRVVRYVTWKAGGRDGFAATELYKVLWFSDAQLFCARGAPITGDTYVRKQHGPFPRHITQIQAQLANGGALRVANGNGSKEPTRFVASDRPDTSIFAAEEMHAIDCWTDHMLRENTARSDGARTHHYAWEIAALNEALPLHAARLCRVPEPKHEDLNRYRRRVSEIDVEKKLPSAPAIILESAAQAALDLALVAYKRPDLAWDAIQWGISHDPEIGPLLGLAPHLRGFTYPGARSTDEPDVDVLYKAAQQGALVVDLVFRDAKSQAAGFA